MKRQVPNVSNFTRSKKPRLNLPLIKPVKPWVTPTQLRNYMMKDPLVDWLKLHQRRENTNHSNRDVFLTYIMNQGIEFENKLIQYINNNIINIVTVSPYITDESVKKTIELMKSGTPIIHSAPVTNRYNKTRGVIDLLVRSDFLYKLLEECPLTEEEMTIRAPKLGTNYHYVVIDIKFSTLPLRANGKNILNSNSYPAYKTQLWIYNKAIGYIQGYTPRYAYILGRRWKYTSKGIIYRNYTCLNKLGVIDYQTVDKCYIEETSKALKWVRDNKMNGHNWSVSPPSRPELYPNMCVQSASNWQKIKEEIADDIGEITNIWYCGIKHRNIGFQNSIKSWRDPRCTSNNIGMNGVRSNIIDKILDINRQNVDKIWPKSIKSNILNWKTTENEIFVDFETISDIFTNFSDLPRQNPIDMIFMIGVYWQSNRNQYYSCFICNKLTYQEEYRIMNDFDRFINKLGNPKIWYWVAEKRLWKRSENRQFEHTISLVDEETRNNILNWNNVKWTDLCDLFKDVPIVIKDCFKFKLKAIAKAMYNHGLITTKLDSKCESGLTASIKAWNEYQQSSSPINSVTMLDIIKYNTFDCQVLYEILTYLRKNHC